MINIIKPALAYYLVDEKGAKITNSTGYYTTRLEKYITTIIGTLTLVGVIWFAIQIILAGFAFMQSNGDPKKMEKAQQQLIQAVIGIVIVVGATIFVGLIMKILNLDNIFDINNFFKTLGL